MSGGGLDPELARDHLQMVDRIMAGADRNVRLLPAPFIAFGIAGGIADLSADLVSRGAAGAPLIWFSVAVWIVAVAISIYAGVRLRRTKQRFSILDGQLFALFNVIWIVTLTVAFGAGHIFTQWAAGAIWSFAYGIALIFVGTQGNRVTFAGGVILIASIVAANFFYDYAGYIFAAGMWIGMAGTGVALYATQRGSE